MPTTVLPFAAATFLLIGGLVCAANAWWAFQVAFRGSRASAVPLIGTAFLGLGLALLPATRPWCWAAVLVDAGTLQLLRALPVIIREQRRTSASQLLMEYRAADDTRTVTLRLYRTGAFVLRLERALPRGSPGLNVRSDTGTWRREDAELHLQTDGESGSLLVSPTPSGDTLRFHAPLPSWESVPETALGPLEFNVVGVAGKSPRS